MRIAVELNNIIRDYNNQILKYYRKGIDPSFDDETADLKCSDLLSELPFENNGARKTFKEIDYPYELFGCAKTTSKHLHVNLSDWLDENENVEVIYFSCGESHLMIQSTYFFLSKGSRVKTMMFLDDPKKIWEFCDVAVTINEDVVDSKPLDKKVIVINRSDNKKIQKKADLVYDKFIDILKDKKFFNKINGKNIKENRVLNKIISKTKQILSWKKT